MNLTKRDLGLLGLIIYFTFIGGTFYSQLNLIPHLLTQVIVSLIFGLWLVKRIRRGEGLPATPLDVGLWLYLALNLVSAWLGLSPRFSLEGVWFSLAHVLAFYLLVDLMRQGWTAKLTWAFFMASAVVCLVGLAEFVAWYVGLAALPGFALGWWEIGGLSNFLPPTLYRLAITLNGSTPLAAYLALFTPVAITLILTLPRHSENRTALQIWLGLALIVQILTFSRAGVLALLISLSLVTVGWLVTGPGMRFDLFTGWRRVSVGGRLALLLGGSLLLGGLALWLWGSFSGRAGSTDFRLTLWQTAWTIFQEHWLSGAGPGNFGRALLRLNEADLPRLQIATAHNVYLNTAAELGLLGLLAGGLLLVTVGWVWWQRWQRTPAADQVTRLRLIGCGAALVGLAGQTVVDTYPATPNMLPLLALLAYLVAGWPDQQPLMVLQTIRGSSLLAWSSLVLLTVYGVWFVQLARADYWHGRSFRLEGRNEQAAALDAALQAQQLDPNLPLRLQRLALLEARLAHRTNDPGLIQAAITHYQAALQQEPILGLDSANLAGLLWQQGQANEALDWLQHTIVADDDPLYQVNLGYFFEQQGVWPEAVRAYGRALRQSPALAGSGFWLATPERAAHWPAIELATVQEAPPESQVALALARGELDRAESLLNAVSGHDAFKQATLAEVYLQRRQPQLAHQQLVSPPATAYDYLLLGWTQWQLGQAPAETSLKTAAFLGERRAYFYLGQLYETDGDLIAAEAAYRRGFSAHATSENVPVTIYGRFGGNDLAPQLLRFGVSPAQAAPWLALAGLFERQSRFAEAEQIYRLLLAEDPFLSEAQRGLAALEGQ